MPPSQLYESFYKCRTGRRSQTPSMASTSIGSVFGLKPEFCYLNPRPRYQPLPYDEEETEPGEKQMELTDFSADGLVPSERAGSARKDAIALAERTTDESEEVWLNCSDSRGHISQFSVRCPLMRELGAEDDVDGRYGRETDLNLPVRGEERGETTEREVSIISELLTAPRARCVASWPGKESGGRRWQN